MKVFKSVVTIGTELPKDDQATALIYINGKRRFNNESDYERISNRHFRGSKHMSANITAWRDLREFFSNRFICSELEKILNQKIDAFTHERKYKQSFYATIDCGELIGYDASARIEDIPADALLKDPYKPHPKSKWWVSMVDPKRTDVKAQATSLITFSIELFPFDEQNIKHGRFRDAKRERENPDWVAIVYTVYPGHCLGHKQGDMTRSRKRVLFSWEHPGDGNAQLPKPKYRRKKRNGRRKPSSFSQSS